MSLTSSTSHYDTLGLTRSATPEQIRRAYRDRAKRTHPDASPAPDAQQRFTELQRAYETLSDPAKRRAYDDSLDAAAAVANASRGPHYAWVNIAGEASRPHENGAAAPTRTEFDEMYDAFFREGAGGASS